MAITQKQKEFIERVGALAAADMRISGVLASLTVAQAILESGWGQSGLTVKANALFGIKAGASWKGKVYNAKTKECYDGATYTEITAAFRAYESWEASVADHSALLTGAARYKAVIGETDYKAACRAIKAAGYATDPTYSDKLIGIIESYGLTVYDKTAAQSAPQKGTGKMKASEFIKRLQDVVDDYKTLYVMGCFGAPLTGANVARYCTNHSYNKQAGRTAKIQAAANKTPPVYGFDCVNLIKGILWGWCGAAAKTYGGATYKANGVPDVGADGMIKLCTGVTTDFTGIQPGEAVWLSGHIGVYIGGGKVIECTPKWSNNVQVTACLNVGNIAGMNGRKWTKRGKLPYIEYDVVEGSAPKPQPGTAAPAAGLSAGMIVNFTGTRHYTSAGATTAKSCKPGKAKITQVAAGSKHPFHLIRESGGGSTVYGWVDAADIEQPAAPAPAPALTVGASVTFTGRKHYTSSNAVNGKSCTPGKAKITQIATGGKHPFHLIRESGGGSTVYGWVDAADIKA